MSRFQFLEQVLRRWNLLVVGYSGSDDFDIVSTIAGTESTKRLLWVDHHSRSDQEVIMQEREALQNKFARFEAAGLRASCGRVISGVRTGTVNRTKDERLGRFSSTSGDFLKWRANRETSTLLRQDHQLLHLLY
jgi:hypothetical protein